MSPSSFTTHEQSLAIHQQLTSTFHSGKTKDLRWRKWQLKQFWWMISDNEDAIVKALQSDLGRHESEALFADIQGIKKSILEHLSNLEKWASDEPVEGAGFIMGTLGKARLKKEPLGLVLIIGAWNFPFLLTLSPVVAAIAAGCTVVIKPSELAVASQDLMAELVPKYLDPTAVRLITAGPAETTELLKLKFNHIFFTGSTKVARFVAAAAAKTLTPTVLELGGQGPAIVTSSADSDLAAKRIAYAKFLNAGQICLSVNHVFVDPSVHDKFTERLVYWSTQFGAGPDTDMCKIINRRNHDRLTHLIDESNGIVLQSESPSRNEDTFLKPTVVTGVEMNDAILSEELFGPVCPVIKSTVEEAVERTRAGPHPLAIYVFSRDKAEIDYVLQNTNSGGVTINDTMLHHNIPGAPFGGVGDSGQGSYHGKYGFMAFTHERTILELPTWLEVLLSSRYPPYTEAAMKQAIFRPRVAFKRGESMEDQRLASPGASLWWKGAIGMAVAAAAFGTVRNGQVQGMAKAFLM